ncbi:MAG: cytochrome b/b6 domain-containing protein [Rubrimonas sp.]
MDRGTERIRLWDPALRVCHWALAAAVAAGWVLGKWGPGIMTWHFYVGYLVAGLLAFRLTWGLAGPRSARFGSFLRGPREVAAYAATLPRRQPSRWRGHNPLGGWASALLLALLAAQVGTGLVADADDYLNRGPFAGAVSRQTALAAAGWHVTLSRVVLAMVALHLAAIAFYAVWKRENLVRPMLDGWKIVRRD